MTKKEKNQEFKGAYKQLYGNFKISQNYIVRALPQTFENLYELNVSRGIYLPPKINSSGDGKPEIFIEEMEKVVKYFSVVINSNCRLRVIGDDQVIFIQTYILFDITVLGTVKMKEVSPSWAKPYLTLNYNKVEILF